jgi:selenium metabolism protein YedF
MAGTAAFVVEPVDQKTGNANKEIHTMRTLDCRGLACPQPVLRTKQLIESGAESAGVSVVVDNSASAQNVVRFLESQGFSASTEQSGDDFEIKAQKSGEKTPAVPESETAKSAEKTLVLITKNTMGFGDDVLGSGLISSLLGTLNEMGDVLWRLVFLNGGVKLTIEGAETLPAIRQLQAQGVSILVCGTCLNHFNLLEQKRVGETTNMLDIVTSLQVADKVISV